MTIVKKQGIWLDASYPWTDTTSAGMMGSIVTEMDAWVSAISANPSIVANGQLPVKMREPTDSTNGGVTNGFAYEFPDTTLGVNLDGPSYPVMLVYGTQSSCIMECGDEYVDDSSNNGFGTHNNASASGHRTPHTVTGDAGHDNQAIVIYDDTDGQEFFAVAFKLGTASGDNAGFVVFKDTSGHWCFTMKEDGFAYDNVLNYWTGHQGLTIQIPS